MSVRSYSSVFTKDSYVPPENQEMFTQFMLEYQANTVRDMNILLRGLEDVRNYVQDSKESGVVVVDAVNTTIAKAQQQQQFINKASAKRVTNNNNKTTTTTKKEKKITTAKEMPKPEADDDEESWV
mmetsp:Transcript_5905/g.8595  ORF Transcript_5905/g.8595 Transcript_5905/m.8595 type:complete len:126 (+) Transcript_5905:95-472(+)